MLVWFTKVVVGRIIYVRTRGTFSDSWDATERCEEHYRKKYKGVEIGEYNG